MTAASRTWQGSVISIQIAEKSGDPMQSVAKVNAVPGKGLEGDRYWNPSGIATEKRGPEQEVTLIEIEAIEGVERDHAVKLGAGGPRRNIVTRGVPLNHLVGREFQVGEVRLRGIRLCEPCHHLAKLSHPSVLPGLVHRGGLRAQIVSGGVIRVDDPVGP
jgi:MOSC domain-containing protein YiiM